MKIIKNMINYKVNTITGADLLKYAGQFNVKVSKEEADKIAAYLRGKHLDIFNDQSRTKVIKEIAKISGPETAKEVNKIFLMFIS